METYSPEKNDKSEKQKDCFAECTATLVTETEQQCCNCLAVCPGTKLLMIRAVFSDVVEYSTGMYERTDRIGYLCGGTCFNTWTAVLYIGAKLKNPKVRIVDPVVWTYNMAPKDTCIVKDGDDTIYHSFQDKCDNVHPHGNLALLPITYYSDEEKDGYTSDCEDEQDILNAVVDPVTGLPRGWTPEHVKNYNETRFLIDE